MDCFYIPKNYIPNEMFEDIEDFVNDDIEEDFTEDQYSDYNLDFGEENEYLMTLREEIQF